MNRLALKPGGPSSPLLPVAPLSPLCPSCPRDPCIPGTPGMPGDPEGPITLQPQCPSFDFDVVDASTSLTTRLERASKRWHDVSRLVRSNVISEHVTNDVISEKGAQVDNAMRGAESERILQNRKFLRAP